MKLGLQSMPIKALIRRNWLATEMRLRINEAKVIQYADEKREGDSFPAPVVFIDPKTENLFVGDGFHRVLAHHHNGDKFVKIDLRLGGYRQAFLHNIAANRVQKGLPFSRGDFERCILTLLKDPETSKWTQTKIAETVGCTCGYVSTVAKEFKAVGGNRPEVIYDRNGIPRTQGAVKDKETVRARKAEALDMLQTGHSKSEIGKKLDISRSAVQRYINDAMREQHLVTCPHCNGTGMIEDK